MDSENGTVKLPLQIQVAGTRRQNCRYFWFYDKLCTNQLSLIKIPWHQYLPCYCFLIDLCDKLCRNQLFKSQDINTCIVMCLLTEGMGNTSLRSREKCDKLKWGRTAGQKSRKQWNNKCMTTAAHTAASSVHFSTPNTTDVALWGTHTAQDMPQMISPH